MMHAWAKGQSGNPGGRPPGAHALRTYLRDQTDDLVEMAEIVLAIARNPGTPPAVRIVAADWVVNRTIGPVLRQEDQRGPTFVVPWTSTTSLPAANNTDDGDAAP